MIALENRENAMIFKHSLLVGISVQGILLSNLLSLTFP
jgi:hypothetical protein